MAELVPIPQLRSLEIRIARSERRLKVVLCLFSLSIGLSISLLLSQPQTIHAGTPDTLRLRKLIVVDDQGRERIVIAAPIPNPIVNGKEAKRRVAVDAGIQFKDPDGTERGGIASEGDGSFMFGIDDASGHERAHLYYIPSRGSGVLLQNGGDSLSFLNPPEPNQKPKIEVVDEAGKPVAEFFPKQFE